MQAPVKRLRDLGRRVAEAQDEALREDDSLAQARARVLSPSRVASKAGTREVTDAQLWGGAALAAALTAAACLLFFWTPRAPALAFQVGPSDEAVVDARVRAGVVGELVAARASERLPLRFSDGSVVRLEPEARARVVEVAENGSRVVLESGTAHASVVHRADTRWSVQAGPYEVRVTGTRFDVAWEPSRGLFTITLLEGRVVVTGCGLERARAVTTGETFEATCAGTTASKEVPAPLAPTPAVIASPASPRADAPTARVAAPVPPAASLPEPSALPASVAPAASPTWQSLLADHRYADALDAADGAGFASILASADAPALMDLGDAARFARRVDRAKAVFQAVRRRFPSDDRASVAAFDLGRIAFDDDAAYADAARWFGVCLDERPSGPLAREASGRRMEALERSGDHAGAQRAAKRYLDEYPSGPHAEIARSIAGP